jgi:hypothetical protein
VQDGRLARAGAGGRSVRRRDGRGARQRGAEACSGGAHRRQASGSHACDGRRRERWPEQALSRRSCRLAGGADWNSPRQPAAGRAAVGQSRVSRSRAPCVGSRHASTPMSASEPERDGWCASDSIDTHLPCMPRAREVPRRRRTGCCAQGMPSTSACCTSCCRRSGVTTAILIRQLRSQAAHPSFPLSMPTPTPTPTPRAPACALRRAKRHRPAMLSDPVCVAAHVRDH